MKTGITTRARPGVAGLRAGAVVRAALPADGPGSAYLRAWPAAGDALGTQLTSNSDALACPPLLVNSNHDDDRVYPAGAVPLPTRTSKIGDGLLVPSGGSWNDTAYPVDQPMRTRTQRESEALLTAPFLVPLRSGRERVIDPQSGPLATVAADGSNHMMVSPFIDVHRANGDVHGVDQPMQAVTAGGYHHGLTVPPGAFVVKNYTPRGNERQMCKDAATEPLGAVTVRDHHALVIPYRRTNRPTSAAGPMHTLSTRDSAGVLRPAIDPMDCYYRMLQPREQLRSQRFPDSYVVKGNKGEQTKQAGAAVSANVAHGFPLVTWTHRLKGDGDGGDTTQV
jgi:DNA (cytosine-5)-methyltransferase 1